ncbi:MAG TPA: hypothetical protein VGZ47_18665 [Gemmataceae bacterium]|nr:hypothetical protein [Gemmataceae bacterium]
MAKSQRPQDYDDDDVAEEPRRRSGSKSNNNSLVMIFAIIGGVALVLILVCGGVAFYLVHATKRTVDQAQDKFQENAFKNLEKHQNDFAKEMQDKKNAEANSDKNKSKDLAESFMQEVKGNRTDAAYKMTSADFQKRMSKNDFAAFVKKNASALQQFRTFFPDFGGSSTGSTFTFNEKLLVAGAGFHNLTLTVIKEGNGWKVDQFSIEPDKRFP